MVPQHTRWLSKGHSLVSVRLASKGSAEDARSRQSAAHEVLGAQAVLELDHHGAGKKSPG